MNKRGWFIPILIVIINALTIILLWSSLPELLPAHYDLEGNAGGTMPIFMLAEPIILLVAVIGFVLSIIKFTMQHIYYTID